MNTDGKQLTASLSVRRVGRNVSLQRCTRNACSFEEIHTKAYSWLKLTLAQADQRICVRPNCRSTFGQYYNEAAAAKPNEHVVHPRQPD